MKITIIVFLSIYLAYSSNPYLKDLDYPYFATQIFSEFSDSITAMKGKTNQTKCYAIKDIKINDTLFEYGEEDIISSENCFLPQREEIFNNITKYTDDIYEQNKMLLAFCIFHILSNPENITTQLTKKQKLMILALPIEDVSHSELLFDYPDLNEYLIAGTAYRIFESERIEKILDRNLNIIDRKNPDFRLYTKIYYYITTHSFNISGQAVILPIMEICSIPPYYLQRPDLNYTNSSTVEHKGNKIIVKSKVNIKQSEQYLFSFNISLDNDLLMLKQGIFAHDNIYDKYNIHKKFTFEHDYETEELYNALKKQNLNPDLFHYIKENDGYDAWLFFELLATEINSNLYKFGVIYFNWWKKYSNDENNDLKHISKQSLTLILRMCYDELEKIKKRMMCDIDEYILKTQEYNNFTEINKKLRNFTIEKVHLINKNIKYLYKDLVLLNYNEIKNQKEKYVKIENNKNS